MDTKILTAILVVGLVATMAGAGIYAYFSDTEMSSGNVFTAGVMDLAKPADAVIAIDNAYPGYTSAVYSIFVSMNAVTTIEPDHMEIDVDTYNFIDSPVESGGINTADDFKKQIEVKTLTWYDDNENNNLLEMVDNTADGNSGFISLYDVEAHGPFRPLHNIGMVGSGRLEVQFAMPTDLPAENDNLFQGDSISITFEFAIAQEAGQQVLS
jgi:predicted ribosomally synthesized peptide with SipW-like signal peptide